MPARVVQLWGELWLVGDWPVSAGFCDGEKWRGSRSGGQHRLAEDLSLCSNSLLVTPHHLTNHHGISAK
jgi:hypothetical protein